jgi:hypothetical protein
LLGYIFLNNYLRTIISDRGQREIYHVEVTADFNK